MVRTCTGRSRNVTLPSFRSTSRLVRAEAPSSRLKMRIGKSDQNGYDERCGGGESLQVRFEPGALFGPDREGALHAFGQLVVTGESPAGQYTPSSSGSPSPKRSRTSRM